jgi:hypothetical protein
MACQTFQSLQPMLLSSSRHDLPNVSKLTAHAVVQLKAWIAKSFKQYTQILDPKAVHQGICQTAHAFYHIIFLNAAYALLFSLRIFSPSLNCFFIFSHTFHYFLFPILQLPVPVALASGKSVPRSERVTKSRPIVIRESIAARFQHKGKHEYEIKYAYESMGLFTNSDSYSLLVYSHSFK